MSEVGKAPLLLPHRSSVYLEYYNNQNKEHSRKEALKCVDPSPFGSPLGSLCGPGLPAADPVQAQLPPEPFPVGTKQALRNSLLMEAQHTGQLLWQTALGFLSCSRQGQRQVGDAHPQPWSD